MTAVCAAGNFAARFNRYAGFDALPQTAVTDAVLWAWTAELLDSPTWGVARPEISGARGQRLLRVVADLCRRSSNWGDPSWPVRTHAMDVMDRLQPLRSWPWANSAWPGAEPSDLHGVIIGGGFLLRLPEVANAVGFALSKAEDAVGARTRTVAEAEDVMTSHGLSAALAWRRLAGSVDEPPTLSDFARYATTVVSRWVED